MFVPKCICKSWVFKFVEPTTGLGLQVKDGPTVEVRFLGFILMRSILAEKGVNAACSPS